MISAFGQALRRLFNRNRRVGFSSLYREFNSLLERNNRILELMADMNDKLSGEYVFDRQYIVSACASLDDLVFRQVGELASLARPGGRENAALFQAYERIQRVIQAELEGRRQRLDRKDGRLLMDLSEVTHEHVEEVGEKCANLGQAHNVLGLSSPDGFVLTFQAYQLFLEENGLDECIRKAGQCLRDAELPANEPHAGLANASREMTRRFVEAAPPRRLVREVEKALARMKREAGGERLRYAVRSSGWGEDGGSSFAGQNRSELNVPAEGVLAAYKQVLAGLYSRRCWLYRHNRGLADQDADMAVSVQRMIDSQVSGVLYTMDPERPGHGIEGQTSRVFDAGQTILISAVRGVGAPVTEGSGPADLYRLQRHPPYRRVESRVAVKPRRLVPAPEGGLVWQSEPPELAKASCLNEVQLALLAETAMLLERFEKRPLDIEWAFDRKDRLNILQVRPLTMAQGSVQDFDAVGEAERKAEPIFADQGLVAHRGVAAGRVFVLGDLERMDETPEGAILVVDQSSPRLSRVMRRVHGIVAGQGLPTGHLASIAREFRVPALVGVGPAILELRQGEEVTLDSGQRTVYRGIIKELNYFDLIEEPVFEQSAEYRLLRRVLRHIAPLSADPSVNRPEKLQTMADLARFIRDRAMESILAQSEQSPGRESTVLRLESEPPLGLTLLDVDGGVRPGVAGHGVGRSVGPDDVLSIPLRALLKGLRCAAMWPTEPVSVDLSSFLSSFTRTMPAGLATPERVGRNLAVVGREYLNLSFRLGYHFTNLEASIGERIEDNAILFRFHGGVTHVTRRSRRARFIAAILERFDCAVELRGDMVVGRFKHSRRERMERQMEMMGWLIGYTRQLDALLHDDAQIEHYVDDFLQRVENTTEVCHEHAQ